MPCPKRCRTLTNLVNTPFRGRHKVLVFRVFLVAYAKSGSEMCYPTLTQSRWVPKGQVSGFSLKRNYYKKIIKKCEKNMCEFNSIAYQLGVA